MRLAPRPSAGLLLALLLATLALAPLGTTRASADDGANLEARAMQIERRLLCPQCTNLRLDVCETQVCADMRALIRERLAQGQSDDQIIEYFTGRYGQRVLADVPRSGFNLVLFGWVGASILAVALVGGVVLWRLRRSAAPPPPTDLSEADDRWLDDQLAGEHSS